MIIEFTLVLISIFLTFYLSHSLNFGSVRASGFVTILSWIVFTILNQSMAIDFDNYLKIIFGASFIGMSSIQKNSPLRLLFAGTFFYGIILFIHPFIAIQGGSLGFCAFLSMVITSRRNIDKA